MDMLETEVLQKESSFIATVEAITRENYCNRSKITLIYREYIKYQVDINNLVAEVKLRTPLAIATGTN